MDIILQIDTWHLVLGTMYLILGVGTSFVLNNYMFQNTEKKYLIISLPVKRGAVSAIGGIIFPITWFVICLAFPPDE